MENEIEVPPYFLCPITLEIMKDPVTLSTGITYDRESIEKWLFSQKNDTCPVTKQILVDSELTPNVTLRRVIQSWCTLHSSDGIERFPTPKPPVRKLQIVKLLSDAKSPQKQMKCLQRLRSIASQSETNRRCMESVGVPEFLASLIVERIRESSLQEVEDNESDEMTTRKYDEALSILHQLQLSEGGLQCLMRYRNGEFVESLTRIMLRGSYESRAYVVMLLKSMFEVADDTMQLISVRYEFFTGLVQILHDHVSRKASKAVLKVLISVCPWGRNRVKAVEAGTVPLLIDLLLNLDSSEKRDCEMILMVLDFLCQCAEGRAEFLKHCAGLAIVSKKILRISQAASERAVRILHSISKFSATTGVLQEMLQLGVVTKLSLVLQVDCGRKARERAKEILKMHAKAWKNSSCIPNHLRVSYPY
ncbi:E3 ubiquitin- ligase PUB23-like [Olea europaea subsp. europaea]|uniref:U-box domain-containing protein n=1 Tax=Olea europaea subsp. europaea TaxID=158383 RepID=A0A8S0UV78_OLEEU|nr:E3 ubiquitin- ligase PUB23-like [Olea europaea subsp. europaea]